MADFADQDLRGSTFRHVHLGGSRLRDVDLSDVEVRAALLRNVRLRGVEVDGLDITGEIRGLTVNGVDVGAYVEAELDRRDPDRLLLRAADPDGFRAAWEMLERRWDATVERARRLPAERLHESVDGEWSFIETLRHLAFATECWVLRQVLGDPAPWDPLSLPWDDMPDTPGVPRDRDVRPSLDEALRLRGDRQATVRALLAGLTAEELDRVTEPIDAPGWPPPHAFAVRECLEVVLNEEWEHRRYAERDLAALES